MTDVDSAFLLSMATVIAIAAVIVVLFHRLRQPMIVGYLVAGMVAGQFLKSIEITEPPGIGLTITDFIRLLASLGIILLTFYIGLEFSFRQLRRIGLGIIAAATVEIMLMIVVGYQLGEALGWNQLESTLLGSMLCIASTMMIARALRESGGLSNEKARLVIGLLVVEDFAAVLILAAVSGLVSTGGVSSTELRDLGLGMALFVASSIIIGLVIVPPLVDYVGRQRSNELLVLTALGLCFSMAFFARWIGLSEAIGSFVMGVIISESKYIGEVTKRIEPVRDLFGAIFFVTVGMLVDLSLLTDMGFVVTALLITAVFIVAKMFACTTSTFITGFGARNAMGAGMSMIAIGEFSLMIAAVAVGAENIRETIYPTIVVVTTLTAMIVPYSVRYSDKVIRGVERRAPRSLFLLVSYMNLIFKNLRQRSRSSARMSNEMRTSISRMFLYILVMVTAVTFAVNAMPRADELAEELGGHAELLRLVILEGALVVVALSLVGIWSRTVRLTEIGTSEAMLATRSAESVGYDATARALKWSFLALYIFVGFLVASPLLRSVVQENVYFGVVTVLVVAVAIAVLWRSVNTIDRKLADIFEQRVAKGLPDTSRDLAEIEDIIAAMEEGRL